MFKTPIHIKLYCLGISICLISLNIQAQFTANAGANNSICIGDTTVVGGNPIAAGGLIPYNYTWTPNYNISNMNASHPSVWPDSTMTYYLHVGDGNGRSAYDSIKITVGQRPVVTMNDLPDMCYNDTPLKLTQGNPSGGYYISTGSPDSIFYNTFYSGIGTHKVIYYYFDSICQYADSAFKYIIVHRSPRVTISPIYDTICSGDTISLNAHGADMYIWNSNFPLTPVSGDSITNASPDSSIAIQLIGINHSGGCKDSITMNIVVVECMVGLIKRNSKELLEIFPNPAHNQIIIRSNSYFTQGELEIIDFKGNIVLIINLQTSLHNVDISGLASGMYFLRFGDKQKIIPFIKID